MAKEFHGVAKRISNVNDMSGESQIICVRLENV